MATPHAHTLYLHPGGHWDSNPEGATARLDARARVKEVPNPSNLLHEPDGDGGWRAVTDEDGLTGIERGLVWRFWPVKVRGIAYITWQGVRVLDDDLVEELLQELEVRDAVDSLPLEDPRLAGHQFCLDVPDAKKFRRRVREAGGRCDESEPTPEDVKNGLEVLEQAASAMATLVEEDAAALAQAETHDFSVVPEFEKRADQYRTFLGRARDAHAQCHQALLALERPGGAVELQSLAAGLRSSVEAAIEASRAHQEAREGAEREMARFHAQAQGRLAAEESPAARHLLFRELGRIAGIQGYEVEDTPDGARVRTKYGWLRLGPGFEFEA